MSVFVLDRRKKPLMPCSEKRARLLLGRRRARVHRRYPFTIRLVDRTVDDCALQPVAVKIDPGSRTTGVAVVRKERGKDGDDVHVLHFAELGHRGGRIRDSLSQRSAFRRGRRSRNLRYRAPRFDNRRKPEGWLPPSLRHRVDTVMTWVGRYRAIAPVTSIDVETVRFDTQKIENPEISGAGYQQGTLFGYEIREYVLERDGRRCVYCGKQDVPLNLDHVAPQSRGGSDRPSNLVCSCVPCNESKDCRPVEEFLAGRPKVLARIRAQLRKPLADAAAVNATRQALYGALVATGLPVATASGGRTKWNRHRLGVPKSHALDAACVGEVAALSGWKVPTLAIACTGRGSHRRTRLTRYGFPRGHLPRRKDAFGFRTGDMVQADVATGRKAGRHVGRVAVRSSGSFNVRTSAGLVQGISHRHCGLLARADGYGYAFVPGPGPRPQPVNRRKTTLLPALKDRVSASK